MSKRKKRRILIAMTIILMLFSTESSFAQFQQPIQQVFDQLGWLAAIDRFYQGYDQIMNTLTMIEQNYQMLQQAYERAKSWSFESPEFNDGSFLKSFDIRDELQDAGKQINRELSNINQIRTSFVTKNISMNGHKYSLKDLAGLGDADRTWISLASDAAYVVKDTVRDAAIAFAKGVPKEKAMAIAEKYGVSPKNYALIQPISEMMQKATNAVLAPANDLIEGIYNDATREQINLANDITKKLLAGTGADLTVTQATQTIGLLTKMNLDQLRELNRSLMAASSYSAWRDRYVDSLNQASAHSRGQWSKVIDEDSETLQEIF